MLYPHSSTGASAIRAVAPPTASDLSLASKSDLEDHMWSYVKERGGDKLIRRILIANNGMAATKTIMSIRNCALTACTHNSAHFGPSTLV